MAEKALAILVLAFLFSTLVFAPADYPGTYEQSSLQEDGNLSVPDSSIASEVNTPSADLALPVLNGSAYDYYTVTFGGPITEEQKAKVESSGVDIVGYAGGFSYTVRAKAGTSPKAKGITLKKIESNRTVSARPSEHGNLKNITIILYPGEDPDRMAEVISAIAPARKYNAQVITIKSATAEQVAQIRAMPGVMMAEEKQPLELFNDYAAPVLGVSDAWSRFGLTGSNTIVGVGDTGLDTGGISTVHLDFRGRVVGISAWCDGVKLPEYCSGNPTGRDPHGHGTHVSGSILGDGTMSNGLIKGMAPGARLFMQSLYNGDGGIYTPDDMRLLFAEARDAGAKLHSNSWGNRYSHYSDSYYIDDFSSSNKDFLIMFAAGNAGPLASTLGSQAHSKNAIVVGSVGTSRYGGSIEDVSRFSSRGPTIDGRYKPDLVAPGEYILSTLASGVGSNPCNRGTYDNYYCFCRGTSMATPLVTGSAALVRDYLITDRSVANPQSALIKAILVAGAEDIPAYGPSPNFNSGFGRINLSNSLPEGSKVLNFTIMDATTGSTFSSEYRFLDSQKVRFVLVWTDPACTSNCDSKALVNDLDLAVALPNGTVFYGNGRGSSSAGPDRLNNVEMVQLNPVPGSYVVNVTGYNVPMGPQEYALVVLGGIDADVPDVIITSPSSSVYDTDTVPLLFTINDSDMDSCWYTLNGAGPIELPGCENTTIGPLADNNYNLVIFANDSGGSVMRASASFTIDTAAPAITIISPVSTMYNTSSIRVNISVSDANPGRTWFFNGTANQTYAAPITKAYADGDYTLTAWANDSVGHLSTAAVDFSVDSRAPAIGFVSPTPNSSSFVLTNHLQVNVSANDAHPANITISLYNASRGLIGSADSTDPTLFANFTDLPDGTYYFNATAYDTLGRVNNTATRTVVIDTLAPVINIRSPVNGFVSNSRYVQVGISITEARPSRTWYFDGTANRTYSYAVRRTFSEGPHTLSVWSNDTAGHLSTASSDFIVDTVSPSIRFVPPTVSSYSSLQVDYVQVNVSASDATLANITVWLYNSSKKLMRSANTTTDSTLFANFTGLPDGTYYFNATAYDRARHATRTATWSVTLDTQPPVINIRSPANGLTYNSTSVRVDISVTEAHPSRTWYFNGTANRTYTSPVTRTFSEGPNTIIVWSNDTAGHLSTMTYDFIVDRPPVVTLKSPGSWTTFGVSTVSFNFTAVDTSSATLNCSLYMDNVLNQTNETTLSNTLTTFTVSGIPNGTHNWKVRCSDDASNAVITASRTFSVSS